MCSPFCHLHFCVSHSPPSTAEHVVGPPLHQVRGGPATASCEHGPATASCEHGPASWLLAGLLCVAVRACADRVAVCATVRVLQPAVSVA